MPYDRKSRVKAPCRVMIIAGSDSGGGAGIQGDIKTVTCLGGYAMTAITALTAQNTTGVYGIHEVPVDFIRQQIALVMNDIGADAFKTGMLHNAEVIETIAESLNPYSSHIPLVVDPVMVAKGGASLLEEAAVGALMEYLIPQATLVTPNIPEAEFLCGHKIHSVGGMEKAAKQIRKLGCKAVLLKGGHLDKSEALVNVLVDENGVHRFKADRIDSRHTHGTGCTLASAIAEGLGRGLVLEKAVTHSLDYVTRAIADAPHFGQGHGPLKHNFMIKN